MLVRTSSTPILGSLLPPPSSPENNSSAHPAPPKSYAEPLRSSKTSSTHPHQHQGPSIRRVQSEGNLEDMLLHASSLTPNHSHKSHHKKQPKILEPIPSFSLRPHQDDDDDHVEETDFIFKPHNLAYASSASAAAAYDGIKFEENRDVYLSIGTLGLGSSKMVDGAGDEHYKKMLQENPNNPLFLRNYAHFLHRKKNLLSAEEYYSRAILADPGDGEILSEYAKLIWELHGDKERAGDYFQRGVQVASQDSHVSAAYANFLWNVEDEETETEQEFHFGKSAFYHHQLVN